MYMFPSLVRNAAKEHQSPKSVMDGMVKSAMMTPEQSGAVDGLIKSALPAGAKTASSKSGKDDDMLIKVKPSATKQDIGMRHFPGSRFA
jgi:hypothetical protein